MLKVLFFLLIFCPSLVKCFEEHSIEISVKEEQENGTLLVDLRSYLSSLNNSNGYLIKYVRPCSSKIYFDDKNRFLIRLMKIDREDLCPYELNCSLTCNFFLQKDEIKLIKLKVNIEDINDNKPSFRKSFYSYELDENVSLDYHIQLEQAEDKDLFSLSTFYYLKISSNDSFPFKLNYDKENHLLELILCGKVEKKKYLFELIVNDNQNEEEKCFIEINILFNQQRNSFPPEFNSKFYKFIISNLNETFIGQVKVKNPEEEIYYRLIEDNSNLFQINSKQQEEIYLKKQDKSFVFNSFYEIFIEAFYLNYLSTLTNVQIYLNLTNSNFTNQENYFIEILIPKLFQKYSNDSNKIFLKENSSIPLTILQLFISQSSSLTIQSSSPHFQIKNDFLLKQLDDEQSYELILIQSIDYEIIQRIHLDFILNYFTNKSIEIIIQNINDCQPKFNQTFFHFHFQENNKYPFLLHTFQAFDQDQLNQINYQIQTSDENTFLINSTTGEFWILKSFDRELKSNYSLSVCAFDGIYRECSSILIDILDENDNICHFNSSSITITINENLPSNTFLLQIQAFDPDYLQNGTLEYKFSSKTSYLTINPINGIIETTSNSFDYEFIQSYSILIIACDNIYSSPSLCCYLQLNINLIDLDDNFPYLISPSINDLFIINYTNKIMPRLKAFDNDIDLKNRLIYFKIIGGTLNSSITIDYRTGQLNLLSTCKLPLYGTLIISLSSQTNIQLTILIHDNQTDPQLFLRSIQQSSIIFSPLFYLISSISIGILCFLLTTIYLLFYFFKQKFQHDDDPLMNTPSTTTLSARSISTNKKIYETYYSFGDSVVNPDVIHL